MNIQYGLLLCITMILACKQCLSPYRINYQYLIYMNEQIKYSTNYSLMSNYLKAICSGHCGECHDNDRLIFNVCINE